MNLDNLHKLIERIEALPREKVDLDYFIKIGDVSCVRVDELQNAIECLDRFECGTIACIAGHIACMTTDIVVVSEYKLSHNLINPAPDKISFIDTAEKFLEISVDSVDIFNAAQDWELYTFKTNHKNIALVRLNWLEQHGEFDAAFFRSANETMFVRLQNLTDAF